jgi:hypothetical protein
MQNIAKFWQNESKNANQNFSIDASTQTPAKPQQITSKLFAKY